MLAGQSQKEFFINNALARIDALLVPTVLGSLQNPPINAGEGDVYRVISGATGEWSGKDGQLALRIADSWEFASPTTGMRIFDEEVGKAIHFNTTWKEANAPASPSGGGFVDLEARAAIDGLIQALRNAGLFPESG